MSRLLASLLIASAAAGSMAYERTVLLENFTTADCVNCPDGHDAIQRVIDATGQKDRCVWVCHHAGYTVKNDKFQIPESLAYTWFYGTGGTYAPALMVDRTDFGPILGTGSFPDGVPVMNVQEGTVRKAVKQQLNTEAHIALDLTQEYDEDTRVLQVTVTGTADNGFDLANPTLNIFLIEDGLTAYQNGKGSKYTHDHVMRRVMTPTWGQQVETEPEGGFTYKCFTTLDAAWKPEKMTTVAFVADYSEDDRNACRVANTIASPLGVSKSSVSIDLSDARPVATEYYTPEGIRLTEPCPGLNIVRTVMSDGTSRTSKTIVK